MIIVTLMSSKLIFNVLFCCKNQYLHRNNRQQYVDTEVILPRETTINNEKNIFTKPFLNKTIKTMAFICPTKIDGSRYRAKEVRCVRIQNEPHLFAPGANGSLRGLGKKNKNTLNCIDGGIDDEVGISSTCTRDKYGLNQEQMVMIEYLNESTLNAQKEDRCIIDFLRDIVMKTMITQEQFIEVFAGGYFIVEGDKGFLYKKFKERCEYAMSQPIETAASVPLSIIQKVTLGKLPSSALSIYAKLPTHSHSKYMDDSKSYRMGRGKLRHCTINATSNVFDLLIGISVDERFSPGSSAFQFEGCRLDSLKNLAGHASDFIKYFGKGTYNKYMNSPKENLGPFAAYTPGSLRTDENPIVLRLCGQGLDVDGEPSDCINTQESRNARRRYSMK
jgi:hypothetical protein